MMMMFIFDDVFMMMMMLNTSWSASEHPIMSSSTSQTAVTARFPSFHPLLTPPL